MHHFLFYFSHLSLLASLTSSTCNIPSPFLSFPSKPQPTFPSLTLSTDLGTLHLGLSWGPGYPDETPSIPPKTYPSPLLILTPTSFPGLGPSKHSFGTIIPGHQSHGTPRGHCRPVLEAQGKGRVRARSQTDAWGARQALLLPSTQALPESEFQHVPDQPEYGIPRALHFLAPSVLGLGWALPEGIRGCSLTRGLEGDFGAALRPVSGML